jgi:hypothetical protein
MRTALNAMWGTLHCLASTRWRSGPGVTWCVIAILGAMETVSVRKSNDGRISAILNDLGPVTTMLESLDILGMPRGRVSIVSTRRRNLGPIMVVLHCQWTLNTS